MKIAIIESKLDGKGGSQRQAISLALELQNMGNNVTVYTLAYDKDKCFTDMLNKLRIVQIARRPAYKNIRVLHFFNYFRYSAAESRAARQLALLIDPNTDVLNPHDRLGFRVAAYAKKLVSPFPVVLMMSDILTKGWIAWRRGQFNKKYKPRWRQTLFNLVIDVYEVRKFILPHEKIVVLDNRTKHWVKEYFGKEADVVRSGLDLEKFPYVERHFLTEKKAAIFMAGIFFIHRRYEDAIRAVRILLDAGYHIKLSIAGNHSANEEYAGYYKDLAAITNKLGLEKNVKFLGKISDEELIGCYQQSDIYISPNHLQSWGLAVFEAMASGCPVIVSKTAGASEVLTDGVNTLLVNPKSPEEIAHAVKRLVDDAELYQKLSKDGRVFVEKNISWQHYAEGMLKVYNAAIKEKKNNGNPTS